VIGRTRPYNVLAFDQILTTVAFGVIAFITLMVAQGARGYFYYLALGASTAGAICVTTLLDSKSRLLSSTRILGNLGKAFVIYSALLLTGYFLLALVYIAVGHSIGPTISVNGAKFHLISVLPIGLATLLGAFLTH